MSREERRIYSFGIVIAAILIIAIVAVLTDGCGAKIDAYAAPVVLVEDFTEESSETSETGLFDDQSAMPCCDSESFRRWYEGYCASAGTVERETDEIVEETSEIPIYHFNVGPNEHQIEPDLQRLLYHYLEEAGIEYWYEGALAQMYQESHGIWWAENPNGLDKGLLQYRTTYWPATAAAYGEPGADIFDWRAQVRVYARQTAARISAGLSVDEIISRHKTSDECPALDHAYIQQVRQWLTKMEAAR